MNPSPPGGDLPGVSRPFTLAEHLTLLSSLAETAKCPICLNNKGWMRPPGIERVTLTTTAERPIEALPYACDWCGFIRLHIVSNYLADPSETAGE